MRGELDYTVTALFLFYLSFYIVPRGVHAVGDLDHIVQVGYVTAPCLIG